MEEINGFWGNIQLLFDLFWNYLLIFIYFVASIITICYTIYITKPKIIASREIKRYYNYDENYFSSDHEYSIDWGHRICLQILRLKIVYPVQKQAFLMEVPLNSTFEVFEKPKTAFKQKMTDRFIKENRKESNKELYLFSGLDEGNCQNIWSSLGNSDYLLEIKTPVGVDTRNKIVRELFTDKIVIINTTSEIVSNYPCEIPKGFKIGDLTDLEQYIQSSNVTEVGVTTILLVGINYEEGDNLITIPIVTIPEEVI